MGSMDFGVRYFFMYSFNKHLSTCKCQAPLEVLGCGNEQNKSSCPVELVTRDSNQVTSSNKCSEENKAGARTARREQRALFNVEGREGFSGV